MERFRRIVETQLFALGLLVALIATCQAAHAAHAAAAAEPDKTLRLRWLGVTVLANLTNPMAAMQRLINGMPTGPQKDALMGMGQGGGSPGDPHQAVATLIQSAMSAARSGDFAEAGKSLDQALTASRSARYAEGEAAALSDTGVIHAAQGRYAEALEAGKQANAIYARLAHSGGHGESSGSMTSLGASLAQAQMSPITTQLGLDVTFLNLGAIKAYLAQYQEAMDFFHRALHEHAAGTSTSGSSGGSEGTRDIYFAMAAVASLAGHRNEAQGYLARGRQATSSMLLANNDGSFGFFDLQPPSVRSEGAPPAPIAGDVRQVAKLLPAAQQFDLLIANARRAESQGEPGRAMALWLQVAGRAAAQSMVDPERNALANAQRLARVSKQSDLAIYYGKRAVNAYQRERAQLATFDREARKAFVRESRPVYEALANSLVDAQRLAEAEWVLRLLRQEEAVDFTKFCPIRQQLMSNCFCEVRFRPYSGHRSNMNDDSPAANALGAVPTTDGLPGRLEQTVLPGALAA